MPKERNWFWKMKMKEVMVLLIFTLSSNSMIARRKSTVAFSILVLLEISKNFLPWKLIRQCENHQVLKYYYQCLQ